MTEATAERLVELGRQIGLVENNLDDILSVYEIEIDSPLRNSIFGCRSPSDSDENEIVEKIDKLIGLWKEYWQIVRENATDNLDCIDIHEDAENIGLSLRKKIKSAGGIKRISCLINMKPTTFVNKLNGWSSFTHEEMKSLMKALQKRQAHTAQ